MNIHDRIERAFERWARFVYRRRWSVVLLSLALAATATSSISRLKILASAESYLRQGDPEKLVYEEFRRTFDNDETVFFLLEAPDVFDPAFLAALRDLHADVEAEVPFVTKVRSLVNARVVRGEGDRLIVEDLFEEWPETPEALAALKARAFANPLYRNLLLSEDGRHTIVNLIVAPPTVDAAAAPAGDPRADEEMGFAKPVERSPFLEQHELKRVTEALDALVEKYRSQGLRVWIAGGLPLVHDIMDTIATDMTRFSAVALGAIASLLVVLFRRVSGVVLPLVTVAVPTASTFGLMGWMDIPISPASQILPSFLLAVGVCNAVHLLAIYYRRLEDGAGEEDALAYCMGHSGLAITMASLTTAGSLVSFVTADLEPLRYFGLMAPVGVVVVLVYSLVLLPALIAVTPIRARGPKRGQEEARRVDRALAAFGDFAARRPWTVVGVWVALLAVGLTGATQLRFEHHPTEWFRPDHPRRAALERASEAMKMAMNLEILVDTGRAGGLHDPDVLRRIDALRAFLEGSRAAGIEVGRAIAVSDMIKEIHQALNEGRPEAQVIPDDAATIAQEMFLFELSGSEDLAEVVDPDHRVARLTLTVPIRGSLAYRDFMDAVAPDLRRILGPAATIRMTGIVRVSARTMGAMLSTTAKSYVLSLALITPLMILLIGEWRLGFLSMIPNLIPIVLTLGLMHWAGYSLDMFTMLIGSIAIGIAVDDTIHFLHNFRRYYGITGDGPKSVHMTLTTAGRAMLVTSLTLIAGFIVFSGATMTNISSFGIITAFTIATAFLADVTLTPALVILATRARAR